ncbi:hypothetical protein [Shimia sp. SDUM112013]|uniref:hypothetical protein n=1 Tax=Shimia sp. SDUM112013 TaxID=3136160 RepID=UPI0032EB0427
MRLPVGPLPTSFDPSGTIPPALTPVLAGMRLRNAGLDWVMYDVVALQAGERALMLRSPVQAGAIVVAWPEGRKGEISLELFEDAAALKRAPGRTLRRFAVAGLGCSNLGAAAFARALANIYGEPVGAIVAGYGLGDLLSEVLGGGVILAAPGRVQHLLHMAQKEAAEAAADVAILSAPEQDMRDHAAKRADAATLVALLQDEGREILSLSGHSKGCLSISFAFEVLAMSGAGQSLEKIRRADIVTLGAPILLPEPFSHVRQYLGALDLFGGLNTHPAATFHTVAGAGHHLNTHLPFALDLTRVLQGEVF